MGKHTPGPWEKAYAGCRAQVWSRVSTKDFPQGRLVLTLHSGSPTCPADHDLAAAAPAMLEALKSACPHWSHTGPITIRGEVVEQIRAALAAAEPEREEDQKAEAKDELTMMPLASITPVPHPKPEADKP